MSAQQIDDGAVEKLMAADLTKALSMSQMGPFQNDLAFTNGKLIQQLSAEPFEERKFQLVKEEMPTFLPIYRGMHICCDEFVKNFRNAYAEDAG